MINSAFISEITSKAKDLGFDEIGFCEADVSSKNSKNLKQFIDNGWHGEMNWLANNINKRIHPKNMWEDAKTAIVVLVNYSNNQNSLKNLKKKNFGTISMYAQNKDYHKWIKGRLKNLAVWILSKTKGEAKVFVDTAPLMEKPLAKSAGLGWIGKHTNLISKSYGNWVFIGVMLLDIKINFNKKKEKNLCGTCSKCIDICPTQAFLGPYKLDARKCISYLTIEHKSHIPRKYRSLVGNRIFGCDDCLAICPWNKYAKISKHIAFLEKKETQKKSLMELSRLDELEFRERFSGSPIKRIGRERFIRNVLIAMGNSSSKIMLHNVVELVYDKSPLIKVAAIWALGKLSKDCFNIEKNKNYFCEQEKDVKNEWFASYKEVNIGNANKKK